MSALQGIRFVRPGVLADGARSRAVGYLSSTVVVLDAVLMVGAVVLAELVRNRVDALLGVDTDPVRVGLAGPAVVAAWLLGIAALGGYGRSVFGAGVEEFKRFVQGTIATAGVVGGACFLASYPLSRGFFLTFFTLGLVIVLSGRVLLRRALHQARSRGLLGLNVLIAGSAAHVDEIANVFRRESWLGLRVYGALVAGPEPLAETPCGIPVVGTPEDALSAIVVSEADIIFMAGGATASAEKMRELVWDIEQHNLNVQVVVAPSVTDISPERVRIRPVGGLPLIHIGPPRSVNAARWAKRTFDVVASSGLILLFAPIFAFTALTIKTHDRGPVLFRQTRIGRDGREFPCYKFRTMVIDAEARLQLLLEQQGHDGPLFKMRDDPRITGPGHWLRRYSLDELPQLLNVLFGHMSLVGPRPPLPREVADYTDAVKRRLRVRPGMTGLWQVSGRSDLSWSEAVRLDLYYVDNWSMMQDVSILMKTFGAVMGSRGAY